MMMMMCGWRKAPVALSRERERVRTEQKDRWASGMSVKTSSPQWVEHLTIQPKASRSIDYVAPVHTQIHTLKVNIELEEQKTSTCL